MSKFRRHYPPLGSPPGHLVGATQASPTVATHFLVEGGKATETPFGSLEELTSIPSSDGLHWIDVQGLADIKGLQNLGERFGLDALVMSDVVNIGQRPKLEKYEGDVFVVLRRSYVNGDGELAFEQITFSSARAWSSASRKIQGTAYWRFVNACARVPC